MSKKTHLKISTPAGIFFEGETGIVTIKTLNGFIGLQANRQPFIGAIDIGELTIGKKNNSKHKVCAISNGIVYADQTKINIVTESIEFKENIDLHQAIQIRKSSEAKLKMTISKSEQLQAQVELSKALNKIKIKGQNS